MAGRPLIYDVIFFVGVCVVAHIASHHAGKRPSLRWMAFTAMPDGLANDWRFIWGGSASVLALFLPAGDLASIPEVLGGVVGTITLGCLTSIGSTEALRYQAIQNAAAMQAQHENGPRLVHPPPPPHPAPL